MSNANKDTTIDLAQVFRHSYDKVEEAVRVVSPASSFEIELSEADGDTVGVRYQKVAGNAAVTSATAIGVVVASASATDVKLVDLYSVCTANITGSAVFSLQVSPDDSANVWVVVATLTAPTTSGQNNKLTAAIPVAARRVRVNLTTAPTTGTATVYVVGN